MMINGWLPWFLSASAGPREDDDPHWSEELEEHEDESRNEDPDEEDDGYDSY